MVHEGGQGGEVIVCVCVCVRVCVGHDTRVDTLNLGGPN